MRWLDAGTRHSLSLVPVRLRQSHRWLVDYDRRLHNSERRRCLSRRGTFSSEPSYLPQVIICRWRLATNRSRVLSSTLILKFGRLEDE